MGSGSGFVGVVAEKRMWTLSLSIAVLTTLLVSQVHSDNNTSTLDMKCPCSNKKLCKPIKAEFNKGPEVYVFSRGTSNVHLWRWQAMNSLVVPVDFSKSEPVQAETLCIAHSQGRKFGVTVEFNVTGDTPGKMNMTRDEIELWRLNVDIKRKQWFADIVTIDLLPYFKNDKASDKMDHLLVAEIIHGLKQGMKDTEIMCIVPWKPPCSKDDDACYFAKFVRHGCDYFLLNPESFLDSEGVECVAQANIPLGKLLYGITEYNSHHVKTTQIVLGVTWHGYDYTCKTLKNNVCSLEDPPTEEKTSKENHTCHFRERQRINYGGIVKDHGRDYLKHDFNEVYQAPYFNYKVGAENHQVWFEDQESLEEKYRLAKDLNLRGIAILYGDDLSPSKTPEMLANEGLMWSWLSHDVLLKKATKHKEHADLHWADTVAGVAVGCFLLGTLLGVIFTCISMQRRVKKPRATPFRADMDPLDTDYTDDPDL